jgi:hypothetical protein
MSNTNDPFNLNLNLTRPAETKPPKPVFFPARDYDASSSDDDYVFRIDFSTLTKYLSCPREFFFYAILKRGPQRTAALNLGSAIHEALELFYLHGFTNEILEMAYNRVTQHYAEDPTSDTWRTLDFALDTVRQYFQKVGKHETLEPIIFEDKKFVERSFEIQLASYDLDTTLQLPGKEIYIKRLHFFYIGKIDLAVEHLNRFMPCDHKTASRLGDNFWKQWQLSGQMLGYGWALHKITGRQPDGAVINVLGLRKPTRTGNSFDPQRQFFAYSPEQYSDWYDNTLAHLGDIISNIKRQHFPTTEAHNRIYGLCPYFDVCTLPSSSQLQLLNSSQYEPVTWDPTE